MSRAYQKTEGIILNTISYRDYDQILTLFTAHAGLIKLMCYGSRSQKSKWRGLCLPLTRLEVVYQEKKGEIFVCRDLTLVDAHLWLKEEFNQLEAACDLLHTLNCSQMLGKEAPRLYALLLAYLKKIPYIADPWILAISFRLKLLKHEGMLSCPFVCQECGQSIWTEAYWSRLGMHCVFHLPLAAHRWNSQELGLIYQLVSCQHYKELSGLALPTGFRAKIHKFFHEYISC